MSSSRSKLYVGLSLATGLTILLVVVLLFCGARSSFARSLRTRTYTRYHNNSPTFPIDAVVTYVDARDPKWIMKKKQHLQILKQESIDNPQRWNDRRAPQEIEEIEVCLLSILKNIEYIRTIRVVTMRPQRPRCLEDNTVLKEAYSSNKISVVHHDEFIPGGILPLFNSNAIECYLHKIPYLSEQFLYFNDDCFVLQKIPRGVLFDYEGTPVVFGRIHFQPRLPPVCMLTDAYTCMRQRARNLEKSSWFSFTQCHQFKAYTKTLYQNCIDTFYRQLQRSGSFSNKFRNPTEVCLVQLLVMFGLQHGLAVLGNKKQDFPEKYINCTQFLPDLSSVERYVALCLNNCNSHNFAVVQFLRGLRNRLQR